MSPVPATSPESRFWPKVVKTESCWIWTGAKDHGGYGVHWVGGGVSRRAHRLAYEWGIGPVPEGMTLDHLCRTRACVNPAHLDPCTAGENAARSPLAPYWVGRLVPLARPGGQLERRAKHRDSQRSAGVPGMRGVARANVPHLSER